MNTSVQRYDLLAPLYSAESLELVDGKGAELFDRQGRRYLTLNELSVCLGAGNERFVRAVSRAAGEVAQSGAANPYKARLLMRLMEATGGDFDRVHLTSSGSEAAEWAVKLACRMTGRSEVVSFWNSIHGRTQLSAGMSGLPKRKAGYPPLPPGLVHTPYPDCARCPFRCRPESCGFACIDFLDQQVAYGSAQDVAAVIIEPCQGLANLCPPPGYLAALRAWTNSRDILLIFDEIQSGMGRTGHMFRYQEEGVIPDLLLVGKGLGNGLHIAGFLMRGAADPSMLPALAGGSGDSVLSCAAACAVFDELLEGGLLENVRATGARLQSGLQRCVDACPQAVRVRGAGLALSLECTDEETAAAVHSRMRANRYLMGRSGACLVFKPPFSLTGAQADETAEALQNALVGCGRPTSAD